MSLPTKSLGHAGLRGGQNPLCKSSDQIWLLPKPPLHSQGRSLTDRTVNRDTKILSQNRVMEKSRHCRAEQRRVFNLENQCGMLRHFQTAIASILLVAPP
jgi:hypothetical protein